MSCSVDLRDVTHVVIQTGYSPSRCKILEIESCLRERLDSHITALFAYDTGWHMGLLVPAPYGVEEDSLSLPVPKPVSRSPVTEALKTECDVYTAKIDAMIDQMATEAKTRFADMPDLLEVGLRNLASQRKFAAAYYLEQAGSEPRTDLYEDLFEMMQEWLAKPVNACKRTAVSDDEFDDEFDDDPHDEALHSEDWEDMRAMSYEERLLEARAVIESLGGPSKIYGTLCFLMDQPGDLGFRIVETLRTNDLAYCNFGGLLGIRYVEDATHGRSAGMGKRRILVLKYDAEHG